MDGQISFITQEAYKPKLIKAKYKQYGDKYTCGNCGAGLTEIHWNYCPNCGRKILWDSTRCLTGR